jgi:hypothetical protein
MAIADNVKEEDLKEKEVKAEAKTAAQEQIAEGNAIYQIIRSISLNGQFTQSGAQPVSVINAYINEFLNNGYRLVSTHHLETSRFEGTPQAEAYAMLYVLVKEVA